MKYIIIFLLFITISCNLIWNTIEYTWQIPIEINTKQEALDYVDTYEYEPKEGVFTPDEFYDNSHGDCEDFSLMLQYLFETKLNIKADLIIGLFDNSVGHAWIESNGIMYESTSGIIITKLELYNPLYKYSYPESVQMVQYYGGFINDKIYKY